MVPEDPLQVQAIKPRPFDSSSYTKAAHILSNLEINKGSAAQSLFKNSDFFRKGEVGDWKNYLTTEMAAALDHKIKEKLHDSGLTFTMPL
ncbi:unnamed protein product [Dovyalis caffra]|uniref:Sulfotransferase n=1 Tax=Dovyalis caffra TaxID=77055 RepID=A0AAV1RQX0_9ROSI|nr:unnamed protein product [Dovyalis caffra]